MSEVVDWDLLQDFHDAPSILTKLICVQGNKTEENQDEEEQNYEYKYSEHDQMKQSGVFLRAFLDVGNVVFKCFLEADPESTAGGEGEGRATNEDSFLFIWFWIGYKMTQCGQNYLSTTGYAQVKPITDIYLENHKYRPNL
ncbi:hypothetical protein CHARACLAT_026609 [Characodon lateralis]|uniref:Uncharacterized protein n=1 Tax=Characodon lateralis TaxID=208331 RepID=A0ABU7DAL9_9TELE|nr:hypothetical protein [Characodon lateralis]